MRVVKFSRWSSPIRHSRRLGKKIGDVQSESLRQTLHAVDRDVALKALDRANVGPVQAGKASHFLLGQAPCRPLKPEDRKFGSSGLSVGGLGRFCAPETSCPPRRSVGSSQAPTARRRGQLCTAGCDALVGASRCVSRRNPLQPMRARSDSAFDRWHPASPVPIR